VRRPRGFDVIGRSIEGSDPARPERLLPGYDSGDHVHPSDAGYAAMADAVPLEAVVKAAHR
jgi:lysophospholipase L1-like esterase